MTKEKKKSKKAIGKDEGPKKEGKAKELEESLSPEESGPASASALQAQILRLQADFDNFRKRTIRERADWYQRANEDIILELLPVLDHFQIGLQTAEVHKSDAAVNDGFKLVYEQFQTALRKFGLVSIDAEGQTFDPHQHEAVTHLPSAEHEEDQVIAQTRRGYKLGDRLIRPAQVVVSSGSVDEAEGSEQQEPQDSAQEGES